MGRLDESPTNFNLSSTFLKLAAQSKYLDAENFYHKYQTDLPGFFQTNEHIVAQVLKRADETRRTLRDVEAESNSTDWSLGTTYLGVTTHYKMSTDNLLSVKLEGVLDNVPLFDQANVIYEIDLFTQWMPLCGSAVKVDQVNRAELAAYLRFKPPLGRDTLLHVYASDILLAHDKMVLVGKSVDEWPPPPVTSATRTVDASTTSSTAATTSSSSVSDGVADATCEGKPQVAGSPDGSGGATTAPAAAAAVTVTSGSEITYHNIYDIYAYDGIKGSGEEAALPRAESSESVDWTLDDDPDVGNSTSSGDATVQNADRNDANSPFVSRPVPWLLNSWFNKKMEILDYRAVFTVLSPHQIQVRRVLKFRIGRRITSSPSRLMFKHSLYVQHDILLFLYTALYCACRPILLYAWTRKHPCPARC